MFYKQGISNRLPSTAPSWEKASIADDLQIANNKHPAFPPPHPHPWSQYSFPIEMWLLLLARYVLERGVGGGQPVCPSTLCSELSKAVFIDVEICWGQTLRAVGYRSVIYSANKIQGRYENSVIFKVKLSQISLVVPLIVFWLKANEMQRWVLKTEAFVCKTIL